MPHTDASASSRPPLTLERNEVVALVNTFDLLARSVAIVERLQARLDGGEVPTPIGDDDDRGRHDQLASALGF